MSKTFQPREDARSEMLLDLARYWRTCAAQSNEPWRSDMMRGTAEEFENAAAKIIRQTLTSLQRRGTEFAVMGDMSNILHEQALRRGHNGGAPR